MKTSAVMLRYLTILCFLSGIAKADDLALNPLKQTLSKPSLQTLSLRVPFVILVPPSKSIDASKDPKWLPETVAYSYPVRFQKDEVQVLLGNFGWEGIHWAQLPVNTLDAALQRYPNVNRIRLFWNTAASFGGQWSDERTSMVFVKSEGKIRSFTKTERAYGGEIHPSKYFWEMGQVTPDIIHEITTSFTVERKEDLSTLLNARGAHMLQRRNWPADSDSS